MTRYRITGRGLEIGNRGNSGQGRFLFCRCDFAQVNPFLEVLPDDKEGFLQDRSTDVVHFHLESSHGTDMGNPPAHDTRTDNCNLFDRHNDSSFPTLGLEAPQLSDMAETSRAPLSP